jgi:hypothetical protein
MEVRPGDSGRKGLSDEDSGRSLFQTVLTFVASGNLSSGKIT